MLSQNKYNFWESIGLWTEKAARKIRYNHVGQKLQRQQEFRKMVNSSEQMAFIFITTESLINRTISSLFLISNNIVHYYVNGHRIPQLYKNAHSFDDIRQLITQTLKQKSVFVYDLSGFTIQAIQKHFHINDEIIKNSDIQNILTKMRSLFSREEVQNYSRQEIINLLGLGNKQLNNIDVKSIPQIWNKRFDSLDFVNIILAWGMNQILSIKYMAYYAIYRYKKLKMEEDPQEYQRLDQLKKENQQLLLKFVNQDLKIQQAAEFFENMII